MVDGFKEGEQVELLYTCDLFKAGDIATIRGFKLRDVLLILEDGTKVSVSYYMIRKIND